MTERKIPFTIVENKGEGNFLPIIKIVGVGGCGSNVANYLASQNIENVEIICANTDKQALDASPVDHKLQLGEKLTRGLGAGGNPKIGKEAAEESCEAIKETLKGADLVCITAGMGGGTGTGAAPVMARIARDMKILTLGFVTRPFNHQGKKHHKIASQGWEELVHVVDALITIPNQKIFEIAPQTPMQEAMNKVNNVLYDGIKTLCEVLSQNSAINMDFADVRTALSNQGICMMGVGRGEGENRANKAAQMAISSPLLEQIDLSTARSMLVHVLAPADITGEEIESAFNLINDRVKNDDCDITQGIGYHKNGEEYVQIMVLATGMGATSKQNTPAPQSKQADERQSLSGNDNVISVTLDGEGKKEEESPYMEVGDLPTGALIPAILRKKKIDSE